MNFKVMVCAAYQMTLTPFSGEQLWLNGTQLDADHMIINDDTKGEIMDCRSVETGDGTYELFCDAHQYTNFTELAN